jgi:hypothetical protein
MPDSWVRRGGLIDTNCLWKRKQQKEAREKMLLVKILSIGMIIFVGALLLQSCAILQSTHYDLTTQESTHYAAENKFFKNKVAYFLPKGRLRLQMQVTGEQCEIKVSEIFVPDPKMLFFVDYKHSVFSDDSQVKIGVDPKTGLLTAIETITEDQTSSIIVGVAQIARAILGLPAPAVGLEVVPPRCQLDRTFDPFDDNDFKTMLHLIRTQNSGVTCLQLISPMKIDREVCVDEVTKKVGKVTVSPEKVVKSKGTSVYEATPGVLYRAALPYEFVVKFDEAVQPSTVENKYTITFENGMLKDIAWVKPSEVLGFISIPADIARAIVAIPGELLTVKVKDIDAEKGLLEAQKNLIQAQLELIAKQKELEEATQKKP